MVVSNLYKNLMEHWKTNGYNVYVEQNFDESGKKDCEELYLNDPLDGESKSEMADLLIGKLLEREDKKVIDEEIIQFVNENLLIKYYFTFVEKLNVYVKEKLINEKELFLSAKSYLNDGNDIEGIKLALTLLRAYNSEESLMIFKVFSSHNEFMFYCMEGLKDYEMCNTIIFDIAKKAKGYGKVIAVTNLEVVNDEIKNWIMECQSENNMLEMVLTAMTFNKNHYLEYFFNGEITKEKFQLLTKKLKNLYVLKGFFVEHITKEIVYGYWQYYCNFPVTFNALYVMCGLLSLLAKQDEDDVLLMEVINCTIRDKENFIDMKNNILQSDEEHVLKDALTDLNNNIDEIIEVALALNIKLEFEDFAKRIDNESEMITIYNYIITECYEDSKIKLIEYGKENLPLDKITNGAEALTEENLDYQYVVDSCFFLIVNYMDDLRFKYIDINLRALRARYTPTRKAAINNLRDISYDKLKNQIYYIENCYKKEVNKELKESIIRFLNGLNNSKRREYKSVSDVKVKPHAKDIFLTTTKVEESEEFDLTVVENKLRNGLLVFLKRDRENYNNENSIMVLTDNGYLIGYVSNEYNYILKNLMDWGKILYGKINNVSDDYQQIEISIYLSYEDVMREVKDTFDMVTDQSIGYLN